MKPIKSIAIILMSCFVMLSTYICVFATSPKDSESKISKQELIENVQLSVFTQEREMKEIQNFDVNDSEMIAITDEKKPFGEYNYISIYDKNGKFQYGYRFHYVHSYSFYWEDNNLVIYLKRSGFLLECDSKGNVVDLVDLDKENKTVSTDVETPKKVVNGKIYKITNNLGLLDVMQSSFSKLVRIDENGKSEIIFDYGNDIAKGTIYLIVLVFSFLFVSLIIFILQTRRNKKKKLFKF